jgi:hypothetical protein
MALDGDEVAKHESYGQIRFSRVQGRANFYGSELQQDHFITLEIDKSEVHRGLTQDRHHTRENLMKLRMTAGQFSELITSMNYGSGVPCTLERYDGKMIQPLPEIDNRKEFVHRKFEERMKDFAKELKTNQEMAKKLIDKKTLSKSDQEALTFLIHKMSQEVSSNIPFFGKCFQENIDEMVFEAKLEIENAIQHKVTHLGLKALHEENKLLENGKSEVKED